MKADPVKYWFPAKRYGWGWALPNTWQGWAVFVPWVVILVVVGVFFATGKLELFIGFTFAWAAVLLVVCLAKGEPPRWRWGK